MLFEERVLELHGKLTMRTKVRTDVHRVQISRNDIFSRFSYTYHSFVSEIKFSINAAQRSGEDTVTGGWRKLRNEKLHNLYRLLNFDRMIKSR
jgi:hypothetical protein